MHVLFCGSGMVRLWLSCGHSNHFLHLCLSEVQLCLVKQQWHADMRKQFCGSEANQCDQFHLLPSPHTPSLTRTQDKHLSFCRKHREAMTSMGKSLVWQYRCSLMNVHDLTFQAPCRSCTPVFGRPFAACHTAHTCTSYAA